MLRVSVDMGGEHEEVSLDGLTDSNCTEIKGIENSDVLIRFADAAMSGDEERLAAAREELSNAINPEAMVDAAGLVASFQVTTRLADGAAVPTDYEEWCDEDMMETVTELNESLGINNYATNPNTREG
jgi:hypothetical protein